MATNFDRSFVTQSLIGVALVAACLFAVDFSRSQEIGSTAERVTLVVAGIIALQLSTRHPIAGFVLLTLVATQGLRSATTKDNVVKRFTPSEKNKYNQLVAYNNQEVTLEEELVHNMIPHSTNIPGRPTYQPVLGAQHLATSLE
jgi:hypothetical protein